MKLDLKELIKHLLDKVRKIDYYGNIGGETIADKNLTSGTSWQNLGSFTLPAGVWIIFLESTFGANTSGYRLLTISTTSTSGGSVLRTERRAPTNGAVTTINITTVAEAGTYYVNAVQNSGSTLTVQTRYTAIKISEALGTNLKS